MPMSQAMFDLAQRVGAQMKNGRVWVPSWMDPGTPDENGNTNPKDLVYSGNRQGVVGYDNDGNPIMGDTGVQGRLGVYGGAQGVNWGSPSNTAPEQADGGWYLPEDAWVGERDMAAKGGYGDLAGPILSMIGGAVGGAPGAAIGNFAGSMIDGASAGEALRGAAVSYGIGSLISAAGTQAPDTYGGYDTSGGIAGEGIPDFTAPPPEALAISQYVPNVEGDIAASQNVTVKEPPIVQANQMAENPAANLEETPGVKETAPTGQQSADDTLRAAADGEDVPIPEAADTGLTEPPAPELGTVDQPLGGAGDEAAPGSLSSEQLADTGLYDENGIPLTNTYGSNTDLSLLKTGAKLLAPLLLGGAVAKHIGGKTPAQTNPFTNPGGTTGGGATGGGGSAGGADTVTIGGGVTVNPTTPSDDPGALDAARAEWMRKRMLLNPLSREATILGGNPSFAPYQAPGL